MVNIENEEKQIAETQEHSPPEYAAPPVLENPPAPEEVPKRKKVRKPRTEEGIKEAALKPKRVHVMTEARKEAFRRCTEARAANIAKRRLAKTSAQQAQTVDA